jgi:NADPH-dependent ferric siderophore reductase
MSSGPVAADRQPVPIPERFLSIPGAGPLALEVVALEDVTPGLRRITLTGDDLRSFEFQAGQDLMIMLRVDAERTTSRRYTIRRFDRPQLRLDLEMVVHHGSGPGMRWANELQPGDRLNAVGPRGKIYLAENVDWHLFAGDESAIAVTLAMMEAIPPSQSALAFIEIDSPDFEIPIDFGEDPRRRFTWVHRSRGSSVVDVVASAEIPAGTGHAYFNGEVVLVSSLKQAALARGLSEEQLAVKAYWGRGKANAGNGEPEKRPE